MASLSKTRYRPPYKAGYKFNRLTVVCESDDKTGANRGRKYLCVCDCGQYTVVLGNSLQGGNTKSCGCLAAQNAYKVGKANTKHGLADKHPLWNIWMSMKARCYNKNNPRYDRYGGRGISICDKWKDSFVAFADDMGERPSNKHSIDRINNDGNYEPSNCRWSTAKEQCNNRGGMFSKHK